jgi:hypothetical protein
MERDRTGPAFPTGVPALDEALGDGLPAGALTEIVSAGAGSGGQLVQLRMLCAAAALGRRAALVDATDAFDPQTAGDESRLGGMIWVRCADPDGGIALRAADLLVRDANIGLVILDLRGCRLLALRRAPATGWYRLQRAAEGAGVPLVVQTSQPLVPSAACRVELTGRFGIDAMERDRESLCAGIRVEVLRARWAGGFAEVAGGSPCSQCSSYPISRSKPCCVWRLPDRNPCARPAPAGWR